MSGLLSWADTPSCSARFRVTLPSAAVPSPLPLVTVPHPLPGEGHLPEEERTVSSKSSGSWLKRRPAAASFENPGASRWRVLDPPACRPPPGAGPPPAWTCTCRCPGRDKSGQRCSDAEAQAALAAQAASSLPWPSLGSPRDPPAALQQAPQALQLLAAADSGPVSRGGPGGNGGRSPGRWPGQQRAFPGTTPLRGL